MLNTHVKEHGATHAGYDVSGDLEFITVYTLFDITKTGILKRYNPNIPAFIDDADQLIRNQTEWNRSRNQQRNLETILQLVSLRAQPVMLELSKVHAYDDVSQLGMSSCFSGAQRVWSVSFATEHGDAYVSHHDRDPLGHLKTEFRHIPMITGLTETAQFQRACIETAGEAVNTVFAVNRRLDHQYARP